MCAMLCYYGLLFSLVQSLLPGIPLCSWMFLFFLTADCSTASVGGAMNKGEVGAFSVSSGIEFELGTEERIAHRIRRLRLAQTHPLPLFIAKKRRGKDALH